MESKKRDLVWEEIGRNVVVLESERYMDPAMPMFTMQYDCLCSTIDEAISHFRAAKSCVEVQ